MAVPRLPRRSVAAASIVYGALSVTVGARQVPRYGAAELVKVETTAPFPSRTVNTTWVTALVSEALAVRTTSAPPASWAPSPGVRSDTVGGVVSRTTCSVSGAASPRPIDAAGAKSVAKAVTNRSTAATPSGSRPKRMLRVKDTDVLDEEAQVWRCWVTPSRAISSVLTPFSSVASAVTSTAAPSSYGPACATVSLVTGGMLSTRFTYSVQLESWPAASVFRATTVEVLPRSVAGQVWVKAFPLRAALLAPSTVSEGVTDPLSSLPSTVKVQGTPTVSGKAGPPHSRTWFRSVTWTGPGGS